MIGILDSISFRGEQRISSESVLYPSKHSLVRSELDILLTARKVLKSSGDSLALRLPELDRLQFEIEVPLSIHIHII